MTVGVHSLIQIFNFCLKLCALLPCVSWQGGPAWSQGRSRGPWGQGRSCGPWAGSAMRWEGNSHSPNIFSVCVWDQCTGRGPGNFGNLVSDLCFTVTLFFLTCSSLSCSWKTFFHVFISFLGLTQLDFWQYSFY